MTTTANKIQDFGAKIGGARKDLYAEAREFAETYAAAANVETLKKCSSFGALVKLPRLAALVKEFQFHKGAIRTKRWSTSAQASAISIP